MLVYEFNMHLYCLKQMRSAKENCNTQRALSNYIRDSNIAN